MALAPEPLDKELIVTNGESQVDWRTILVHEAGHAVAALELFDEAADIRLAGKDLLVPADRASYAWRDVVDGCVPDPRPPLSRIITYAAGAKAEELLLGTQESLGFASDLQKINMVVYGLRLRANRRLSERPQPFRDSIVNDCAELELASSLLAEAEKEVASNYEKTRSLLACHLVCVEEIAKEAIDRLGRVDGRVGTILMGAADVSSIWHRSRGDKAR